MKLSYTLTLDDYKAALRLHTRQKLSRRINFILLYRVLPVLAFVGLMAASSLRVEKPSVLLSWPLGAGAFLLWFVAALPLMDYYRLRDNFRQFVFPLHEGPISFVDIDDEGILSGESGAYEIRLYWTGFTAFAQDENILSLYTAANRFVFFPTRALSPAQRTELNDLVARKMVRK